MFSQVCLQAAKIKEQRQPANKGGQRAFGESVQSTRTNVVRLKNVIYGCKNLYNVLIPHIISVFKDRNPLEFLEYSIFVSILLFLIRFAEKAVLGHFILLALLWLFREPKFMDGWSIAFKKG